MTDRDNRENPTGLGAYFQAINEVFALQTRLLTGAIPHYGERGRNDEQRLANLLHQVLPRRYSLGSGFIICAHPQFQPSTQMDIVIHDEIQNSPLFRELTANVYPLECVYGTVEVKASLTIDEIRKSARAIGLLRDMAVAGKLYSRWEVVSPNADGMGQGIELTHRVKLAPRAYLVGYDAEADSPESFLSRMATIMGETPKVFFHGIYAIRQQWFFAQEFEKTTFRPFVDGDALLSFVAKMIGDLNSFPMFPMAFSKYVQNDVLKREMAQQEDADKPR